MSRNTIANFGHTNQLYSFGKEERLPSVKRPINQSIGSDVRSSMTKRSAGFGIGMRFKSPSPTRQSL